MKKLWLSLLASFGLVMFAKTTLNLVSVTPLKRMGANRFESFV